MNKKKSLALQFTLFFLLFALVTITVSGVITYLTQTQSYHAECEKSLQQISRHLSELIGKDGQEFIYLEEYFKENNSSLRIPEDYIADLPESEAAFYRYLMEHYPDMQYGENLQFTDLDAEGQRLCATYRFEYWLSVFMESAESFDLSYVYYVYPTDEAAHKVVYMFDPSLAVTTDGEGNTILDLADEVYEDPLLHKFMWQAWNDPSAEKGFDKIDNEFGFVYTYCTPLMVQDKKMGLICADISVDYVNSTILTSTARLVLILMAVLALSTFALMMLVDRRMIARVVRLEKSIGEYSETKDPGLARKIKENMGREDELGSLYQKSSDMILELEEHMKNLQAVTAEKERIGAELDVATHIQASMLPRIFPPFPERDDIDLYATMQPAKEVGGDFYDFFLIDDTHLAVVMADVSGKGVPAALIMVIAKTLIKNHLLAGETVEDAMIASNMQLLENNDEMLFVTAWVGIIDLTSGLVEFADAGHEPAFVLKQDGTVVQINHKKKKPPLATIEGTKYLRDTFTLEEGDRLFLYTDGVPEAINLKEELYSKERLQDLLTKHTADTPREIIAAVKADMDAYVGEAMQFDDITMLAVTKKNG
ncbi:MAG: PP2C family protein-serine/threonine phosphatase [Lachnospiraceae bacterium]|nr:PP2C family protein-serine/threonine phosphatase [Lachnospiraceae bacterium]